MHDIFAFAFHKLVGESAWTKRTRCRILQVANYSYPILISGPTGSGRELVARAVHAHSSRAQEPFIPFRCSVVPDSLRASQLFGQVAGSSSFVTCATLGAFGAAEGGTLYLEDVADLDIESQAQLLTALRDKRITPYGTDQPRATTARIIASSDRDLDQEVRQGRFSFELLYRLNVLPITMLGLKERVEDIEPLVRHIIARVTLEYGLPLKQLSPSAMALLQSYDWPGNVDELFSVVERAVIMSPHERLGPDEFPEVMEALQCTPDPVPVPSHEPVNAHESVPVHAVVQGRWPTLADLEASHIRETLAEARYNQVAAARMLGIPLSALMEKIRRHRIRLPLSHHDRDAQEV